LVLSVLRLLCNVWSFDHFFGVGVGVGFGFVWRAAAAAVVVVGGGVVWVGLLR